MLWGRRVVAEALRGSNRSVEAVYLEAGPRSGPLDAIETAAAERGVPVEQLEAADFARLDLPDAQRVAARCGPFRYKGEGDVPAAAPGGSGTLVVLDHLEDPQNTGAIIRTAEAAGCIGVCIPDRRAAGVTAAVARAAAGATEHIDVFRIGNVARLIKWLQKNGYWTVALDGEGHESWDEVDYRGHIALVVGAEGKGVQRIVRERCDHSVALPLRGRIDSLNASAAFAAVMYEVVRQRTSSDR